MSYDLTALGITEALPTSSWDGFDGETPVLPVESSRGPALLKGLYILKVPEFKLSNDTKDPFIPVPHKETKRLQFKMNPVISRPEAYAGRVVYGFYIPLVKSDKQKFSRGTELLIAAEALGAKPPNGDQEWIQAAFDLSGREFGAILDLRIRDSQSQKEYFSKQDLFYKREDGSPKLSYVIDIASGEIIHKEGDDEATKMAEQQALDQQTGRRLYANPYIVRLVSLSEAIKALDSK